MVCLSFISATEYKPHTKNTDLQFSITSNNATACNVTGYDSPNGYVDFAQEMTKNFQTFNSTYYSTNFTVNGVYCFNIECSDSSTVETGSVCREVTQTGQVFSQAQGFTALGILMGALGLAFLLMLVGIRLGENDKYYPIAFMFMVLSIILGVYSLNLGYAFTNDILQYESLTSVAQVIYTSFLWLMVSIVIITMALMLIAFIKELGKMGKTKKFGEGFNPITNSYDF
jgi:hypothetical protein